MKRSSFGKLFRFSLLLFLLLIPVSAKAQNAAVTINVDANANRRVINPNIYGVAHAATGQIERLE
jgi:hypothetical protein